MNELNKTIGNNLILFRKKANLTQAELAEKLNYSDKSISKWERGESSPDVATLKELAELYGISVNDFLTNGKKSPKTKKVCSINKKHLIISLLSFGLVWFVATCIFVLFSIFWSHINFDFWLIFIYAIPLSFVVLTIFNKIWKNKMLTSISNSVIVWTTILSLYLSVPILNNWLMFMIAVPFQILIIFWFFFKLEKQKEKQENNNEEKK